MENEEKENYEQRMIKKYMGVYAKASKEELQEYYRTAFSHKLDQAYNLIVAETLRKNLVIGILTIALVVTIFISIIS